MHLLLNLKVPGSRGGNNENVDFDTKYEMRGSFRLCDIKYVVWDS